MHFLFMIIINNLYKSNKLFSKIIILLKTKKIIYITSIIKFENAILIHSFLVLHYSSFLYIQNRYLKTLVNVSKY